MGWQCVDAACDWTDPSEKMIAPCPICGCGVIPMSTNSGKSDIWASPSGAKSSGQLPFFHLIPWRLFAERLAARYAIGEMKYPSDGARAQPNYLKGIDDRTFIIDRLNHLLDHVHKAAEEIRTSTRSADDNLAAVLWGAIFLMAAQDTQTAASLCKNCALPQNRHVLCPDGYWRTKTGDTFPHQYEPRGVAS